MRLNFECVQPASLNVDGKKKKKKKKIVYDLTTGCPEVSNSSNLTQHNNNNNKCISSKRPTTITIRAAVYRVVVNRILSLGNRFAEFVVVVFFLVLDYNVNYNAALDTSNYKTLLLKNVALRYPMAKSQASGTRCPKYSYDVVVTNLEQYLFCFVVIVYYYFFLYRFFGIGPDYRRFVFSSTPAVRMH